LPDIFLQLLQSRVRSEAEWEFVIEPAYMAAQCCPAMKFLPAPNTVTNRRRKDVLAPQALWLDPAFMFVVLGTYPQRLSSASAGWGLAGCGEGYERGQHSTNVMGSGCLLCNSHYVCNETRGFV
jgi:hypothetical protein